MSYNCVSGGYSSSPRYNASVSSYSSLDAVVSYTPSASAAAPSSNLEMIVAPAQSQYQSKEPVDYKVFQTKEYFTPTNFLHNNRPLTQFIEDANDIEHLIRETFEKTTGQPLPNTIQITVAPEEKLENVHRSFGGSWSPTIQGFAIHATNQAFIKQGPLDEVMITVGHELGHLLSKRLPNDRDEEAKAFAFSIAWMKTIKDHNIANLASSIQLHAPAQNGIHNVALSFTQKLLDGGQNALEIFFQLADQKQSIESCF